jgi:serine/threonine protein kinase
MVIGGPAGRPSRGGSAHEPPTDEMTVKLTDFGIARAAEQTRLTQVGSVVGTAAYLSPEQSRGEETTPAADVYALGVVVYQMLTARLPWEGSTLAELAIRRESESPLPPTSYDDTIPETLSTAVLRALEGDLEHRYETAKELSAALRAGISGREPPEAADTMPTRAMAAGAAATAATRAMADSPDIATPVAPEPAYVPPPRARQPVQPAAQPKKRSAGSRFMRTLGVLLLIAVLAAAIAAVVLLVTDAGQDTDLGRLISDEIDQQIDNLKEVIRENLQ